MTGVRSLPARTALQQRLQRPRAMVRRGDLVREERLQLTRGRGADRFRIAFRTAAHATSPVVEHQIFQHLLAIAPDFSRRGEVMFRLALIYKQVGKYEKAAATFESILEDHATSPSPDLSLPLNLRNPRSRCRRPIFSFNSGSCASYRVRRTRQRPSTRGS